MSARAASLKRRRLAAAAVSAAARKRAAPPTVRPPTPEHVPNGFDDYVGRSVASLAGCPVDDMPNDVLGVAASMRQLCLCDDVLVRERDPATGRARYRTVSPAAAGVDLGANVAGTVPRPFPERRLPLHGVPDTEHDYDYGVRLLADPTVSGGRGRTVCVSPYLAHLLAEDEGERTWVEREFLGGRALAPSELSIMRARGRMAPSLVAGWRRDAAGVIDRQADTAVQQARLAALPAVGARDELVASAAVDPLSEYTRSSIESASGALARTGYDFGNSVGALMARAFLAERRWELRELEARALLDAYRYADDERMADLLLPIDASGVRRLVVTAPDLPSVPGSTPPPRPPWAPPPVAVDTDAVRRAVEQQAVQARADAQARVSFSTQITPDRFARIRAEAQRIAREEGVDLATDKGAAAYAEIVNRVKGTYDWAPDWLAGVPAGLARAEQSATAQRDVAFSRTARYVAQRALVKARAAYERYREAVRRETESLRAAVEEFERDSARQAEAAEIQAGTLKSAVAREPLIAGLWPSRAPLYESPVVIEAPEAMGVRRDFELSDGFDYFDPTLGDATVQLGQLARWFLALYAQVNNGGDNSPGLHSVGRFVRESAEERHGWTGFRFPSQGPISVDYWLAVIAAAHEKRLITDYQLALADFAHRITFGHWPAEIYARLRPHLEPYIDALMDQIRLLRELREDPATLGRYVARSEEKGNEYDFARTVKDQISSYLVTGSWEGPENAEEKLDEYRRNRSVFESTES